MTASLKIILSTIVTICLASLLIAYFYMEQYLALPPCHLCILARFAIGAIALFSLLTIWCYPSCFKFMWWLSFITLIAGVITAARHVWLTYNPYADMCSFDPEEFSIINFITKAFRGTDDCGSVTWTFLGLNIPEQTLILYLVLAILLLSAKRIHKRLNKTLFL